MTIYLASPYTAATPQEEMERFIRAAAMAGVLMTMGHIVYCPIAHSHPIRQACPDVPGTWEFWKVVDEFFIDAMETLVVLRLPGWKESPGVTAELEIAAALKKQIGYIDDAGTEIEWDATSGIQQTDAR